MGFFCNFSVAGHPAPKGSMDNFLRGGHIVSVDQCKKLKPWTMAIINEAKKYAPEKPSEKPFLLNVFFYLKKPKKPKHELPIVPPDRDKLLRAVQDALQGIFYKNDSQVVDGVTKKNYDNGSGVGAIIHIKELD